MTHVFSPQLCADGDLPEGSNWTYQIKWDGVRCVVRITPGSVELYNRSGMSITRGFPEVVDLLKQIKVTDETLIDCELVALKGGQPDFRSILVRCGVQSTMLATKLSRELPGVLVAFDLIKLNGDSLENKPYLERYNKLNTHFSDLIKINPLSRDKNLLVDLVKSKGLEGVIARDENGIYQQGERPNTMVRWKQIETSDLMVYGWEEGSGYRYQNFGAFLLATQEGFGWRFVGKVSSGISDSELEALLDSFIPVDEQPPVINHPELENPVHYIQAGVILEISHLGYENGNMLRNPSFLRRREDKELNSM